MSLSYGQMFALELVPKIGASLSLLGSGFILGRFATHRTELSQRITHRILFGMSIADVLNSLHFFASSWAAPAGSPDALWAVGTQLTCSLQAFLGNFGIILPIYNVALSTFYYLTVVHSWRERDFVKLEWVFHLVPILFCLATGMAALFQKLYAYAGSWCWIAPYPPDCLESFYYGYTTCERGDNWSIYRWAYWYVPLWISLVAITILQVLMYRSVRGTERQAGRWDARARLQREHELHESRPNQPNDEVRQKETDGADAEGDKSRNSLLQSPRSLIRQKSAALRQSVRRTFQAERNSRGQMTTSSQVYGQCLAYVLAAYGTFLFPTINRITTQATGNWYFGLALLHALTEPTQGLWNYLVFNRPRYLKYRRSFPEHGRLRALYSTFLTFGASTVTDAATGASLFLSFRLSSMRLSKRLLSGTNSQEEPSSVQKPSSLQILHEDDEAEEVASYHADHENFGGDSVGPKIANALVLDGERTNSSTGASKYEDDETDAASHPADHENFDGDSISLVADSSLAFDRESTSSPVNPSLSNEENSQSIPLSETNESETGTKDQPACNAIDPQDQRITTLEPRSSSTSPSVNHPERNNSIRLEDAIEGEIEFC